MEKVRNEWMALRYGKDFYSTVKGSQINRDYYFILDKDGLTITGYWEDNALTNDMILVREHVYKNGIQVEYVATYYKE
jgi:hypothetical protein